MLLGGQPEDTGPQGQPVTHPSCRYVAVSGEDTAGHWLARALWADQQEELHSLGLF